MFVVPSNTSTPATITILFFTATFGVDLTTVTAVSLNVRRRDGSNATWAMTITSAVPGELIAQYTFASGDLTGQGLYYLEPLLSIPGGSIPANSVALMVADNAPMVVQQSTTMATSVPVTNLGPVRQTWVTASGAYVAKSLFPWVAVDLSAAGATVTLWPALDGDNLVVADYKNSASGGHSCLIVPAAGQTMQGGATSASFTTAGFVTRLKFSAAVGQWLNW